MKPARTGCIRLALALVLLAVCGFATAARHALVIGNNAYRSGPLKSAVNDARDMAQALQQVGFEVLLRESATRDQMFQSIREFGSRLKEGDIALFFYAGHAIQLRDRNYLIPVDAQIEQEDDVTFFSLDVVEVLQRMDRARTRVNVLMIDACRDNPFASAVKLSSVGLAQMAAPPGTLIAYATAPGQVAREGVGRNGVYTRHLLRNIGTPDLPIEQMLKRVREGVFTETRGQQVPWDSSSLRGDLVLAGTAPPQAASRPAPGGITADTQVGVDRTFWESIKDSRNAKEFEAYLEQFPDGVFVRLAKSRLEQLKADATVATVPVPASQVLTAKTGLAPAQAPVAAPAPVAATAPAAAAAPATPSSTAAPTPVTAPTPTAPAAPVAALAPATAQTPAAASAPAPASAAAPPTSPVASSTTGAASPPAPPQSVEAAPLQISRGAGPAPNAGKEVAVVAPASLPPAPAPAPLAMLAPPAPAVAPRTTILSDGSSFTGALVDGRPHGRGRFVSPTAGSFEGEFVMGIRQGAGEQVWPSGDRYQGNFVNNIPHGAGTMIFANGDRYEGSFEAGRFQGKGMLQKADGFRYEGDFVAGRRQGKGSVRFPNGDRFEGGFVDEVASGVGVMIYGAGGRYEGTFAKGVPEGKGKYSFADGSRYEGEFRQGEMSGLGTYFYPNGDRHEGMFATGTVDGDGVRFFSAGGRFEGTFSQRGQKAEGMLVDKTGTRRSAVLENGQFKARDG